MFWCAAARMSELELEQRTNITFLVKLGKSGNEIRETLVQVYGDNAMKKTAVYKWVKRFSEGRESVTDEERSGRPTTEENIAKVRQILRANRRMTVRSIAEQMNIDKETVREILTEDLDMRKVCAKMVPKELTEEQKQRRVTICQDLLKRQGDILGRVITGDKTWVYQYDPETKRQSAQWKTVNSPRPKIPLVQIKSQNMLLTFFILKGLFIMNLYQLDKQSTKFTIWKYWKGCVENLDGNDPNFCQQLMDLAPRQRTCSHGTVCEGVFNY